MSSLPPTVSSRRASRLVTALVRTLAAAMLSAMTGAVPWADVAAGPVPRAGVFDFVEPAGWQGRMVGRRGADAVSAALAETGRWALADRGLIIGGCAREQLAPPFAVGHLQMLGQRMRTPLAVAGVVDVCEVNARRRTAQITLVAELVETLGGNSLASVRGVASAHAEAGAMVPLDVLVDRALVDAAADIARALTNFEPGAGRVMAVLPDGRVMLDVPEQAGLRPGDRLMVYRDAADDEPVGVLTVQTVKVTVVHAQVLVGGGFRGGDQAVLVAR
ncbi:MAG: hypothetical protein AB7Y46_20390 [Armatimonadota bacterium]